MPSMVHPVACEASACSTVRYAKRTISYNDTLGPSFTRRRHPASSSCHAFVDGAADAARRQRHGWMPVEAADALPIGSTLNG